MSLDLANYEERAKAAVALFWETRSGARKKQQERGVIDVGGRASVTSGKNMDGFVDLVKAVVAGNGLSETCVFSGAELQKKQRRVTLPGFYRPVKDWDLVIVCQDQLVAALEFKSQVGPSFGNNFNNRCEEAIGTATDIWVAYREGALGDAPRPFLGYLMLLEDAPRSRSPVTVRSNHFDVFPEFENASYADRYEILCHKLVQERLYEAATLLLSPKEAGRRGVYTERSEATGLKRLVAGLASHIAEASALDYLT